MLMLLLLFAHTKWPDVVFRNYDGSNLSRGGLKLKKKKGGKNTQRVVDLLGRVFTTIREMEKEGGDPRWNSNFFPAAVWGTRRRGGGEGRGGRRFEKFESTRNQKAEPHYKLKWNFQLPLDGYMVFYA